MKVPNLRLPENVIQYLNWFTKDFIQNSFTIINRVCCWSAGRPLSRFYSMVLSPLQNTMNANYILAERFFFFITNNESTIKLIFPDERRGKLIKKKSLKK